MSDNEKFLNKLFGNDIYSVIKSTLNLIDKENITIPNTENYDFNSLTGKFKLTKDTDLSYDVNEFDNSIFIIISTSNSITYFTFNKNNEFKHYGYKEMLNDGSLLNFEYFYTGEEITQIFDDKVCLENSINQTSDLIILEARNILPTYFDIKNNKYNLNDFLNRLNDLKELKDAINKPKKRGK